MSMALETGSLDHIAGSMKFWFVGGLQRIETMHSRMRLSGCRSAWSTGCVLFLASVASGDVILETLESPDNTGQFGSAVATDGLNLAVGTPGIPSFGVNTVDAVWIFDQTDSVWTESVKLVPSLTSFSQFDNPDNYGSAVDLENGTLVVGAPGLNQEGFDTGGLFIYSRNSGSGSWTEVYAASGPENTGSVGTDVAISGDWIIVGGPGSQMEGTGGSATFLSRSGGAWSEQATIQGSDQSSNDELFGAAVGIDDDVAVIGAAGINQAWVVEKSNSAPFWEASGMVELVPESSSNNFGKSVAIEGDLVAIGDLGSTGSSVGLVYLFRKTGKGWIQEARLAPPLGSNVSKFGYSIDIKDGRVIVGMPASTFVGSGQGAVFEFKQAEGIWNIHNTYRTEDNQSTSGLSVAASDHLLQVGAPRGNGDSLVTVFDRCLDCDDSGICDTTELEDQPGLDCDDDGLIDYCAISNGDVFDCNRNGLPDSCDLAAGDDLDCDEDGVIDHCAITGGLVVDCDDNGRPDSCDISDNPSLDCNGDGRIDSCSPPVLEIVFIYDTSGSVSSGKGLCGLTEGAVILLKEQGYEVDEIHTYIDGSASWCSCSDFVDGLVDEPGYGPDAPVDRYIDSVEDWADAAAVVASHHPWEDTQRVIVVLSDECPERGDGCDEEDQKAIDNAIEVLNAANVNAVPIATNGGSHQELHILAGQLAYETEGEFIDDSNGELTSVELAEVLEQFAPQLDDGNGVCGTCLGDLNCDGEVGGEDLTMMLGNWGIQSNPPGDLNGDCVVTGEDLAILLGYWGPCPD